MDAADRCVKARDAGNQDDSLGSKKRVLNQAVAVSSQAVIIIGLLGR
jgi:hypothetical protein